MLALLAGCDSGTSTDVEQLQRVLTAEVEQRQLREFVTARGRVEAEHSTAVFIAADGYITGTLIGIGDRVEAGDAAFHVNGQPVLLFQAPFPAWRDIAIGDRGPDVDAIKAAIGGEPGEWSPDDLAHLDARMTSSSGFLIAPAGSEEQLQLARRTLEDQERMLARARRGGDRDAIEDAQREVERAQEAVELAERSAVPIVPMASYAFVSSLPARAANVPQVGEPTSDAQFVLRSDAMVFRGPVPATSELRVGDIAEVGEAGISVIGVVSALSAPDSDGFLSVTITPTEAGGAFSESATSARILTVETDEVLAVPIAGVWTDAQGQTFLTTATEPSTLVAVTTGRTVGGWVELVDAGGLAPGDRVRTGVWITGGGG